MVMESPGNPTVAHLTDGALEALWGPCLGPGALEPLRSQDLQTEPPECRPL